MRISPDIIAAAEKLAASWDWEPLVMALAECEGGMTEMVDSLIDDEFEVEFDEDTETYPEYVEVLLNGNYHEVSDALYSAFTARLLSHR